MCSYVEGCTLCGDSKDGFEKAARIARESDVVIVVMGLNRLLEGEEGAPLSESKGDRINIGLPGVQEEMLKELHATGTPVVLVLISGSAIADILFGDHNPAGRLPVTYVRSLDQLQPFEDYDMKNRTYRFMREEPLYRFGYGLSYTRFQYSNLRLSAGKIEADETVTASVAVENVGDRAGDEVVQVYISNIEASVPVHFAILKASTGSTWSPGEGRTVSFTLPAEQSRDYDEDGNPFVEPREFASYLGGAMNHRADSREVSWSRLCLETEPKGGIVRQELLTRAGAP